MLIKEFLLRDFLSFLCIKVIVHISYCAVERLHIGKILLGLGIMYISLDIRAVYLASHLGKLRCDIEEVFVLSDRYAVTLGISLQGELIDRRFISASEVKYSSRYIKGIVRLLKVLCLLACIYRISRIKPCHKILIVAHVYDIRTRIVVAVLFVYKLCLTPCRAAVSCYGII